MPPIPLKDWRLVPPTLLIQARAVLQAVADAPPYIAADGEGGAGWECVYCGAWWEDTATLQHSKTCLIVRARAWLAAYGERI